MALSNVHHTLSYALLPHICRTSACACAVHEPVQSRGTAALRFAFRSRSVGYTVLLSSLLHQSEVRKTYQALLEDEYDGFHGFGFGEGYVHVLIPTCIVG